MPGMYFLGFSRYSNCRIISEYPGHSSPKAERSVSYQSVVVPRNALLLVGVGVRETFDLTRLSAKETVEVGADLVALTLLQVVALSASCLEESLAVPRGMSQG